MDILTECSKVIRNRVKTLLTFVPEIKSHHSFWT